MFQRGRHAIFKAFAYLNLWPQAGVSSCLEVLPSATGIRKVPPTGFKNGPGFHVELGAFCSSHVRSGVHCTVTLGLPGSTRGVRSQRDPCSLGSPGVPRRDTRGEEQTPRTCRVQSVSKDAALCLGDVGILGTCPLPVSGRPGAHEDTQESTCPMHVPWSSQHGAAWGGMGGNCFLFRLQTKGRGRPLSPVQMAACYRAHLHGVHLGGKQARVTGDGGSRRSTVQPPGPVGPRVPRESPQEGTQPRLHSTSPGGGPPGGVC